MDEHQLENLMSNGAVLSVDPNRKPRFQVTDSSRVFPVKTYIARRWLKGHHIQVVAVKGTLQEVVLAEYADLFYQRGK